MKGVLEEKAEELYHWELRVGLDPPQMHADKQAQEVRELLHIATREMMREIQQDGKQRPRQILQ